MKRLTSLLLFFLLFSSLAFAQDANVVEENLADSIVDGGTEFWADIVGGGLTFFVSKLGWVFSSVVDIVANLLQIPVFNALMLTLVPVAVIIYIKLDWILGLGEGSLKLLILFFIVIFLLIGLSPFFEGLF